MDNQNIANGNNFNNSSMNGTSAQPINNQGISFDFPTIQPVNQEAQPQQPEMTTPMYNQAPVQENVQPVQPVQQPEMQVPIYNQASVQENVQPVQSVQQPEMQVPIYNQAPVQENVQPIQPMQQPEMATPIYNQAPVQENVQPTQMQMPVYTQSPLQTSSQVDPSQFSSGQSEANINPALNSTSGVSPVALDPNQVVTPQEPNMVPQQPVQPETNVDKKSGMGFIIVLFAIIFIVIIALPYIANLLK